MTNIKKLSNLELLTEVKTLVSQERNLLLQILHYLKEIELRRLYLERGYSSLFSFCVEDLGYEESQAQRRISAMRLIRELPEVENKIEDGSLSLTALTQAQSFFRKKALNEKPMDLIQKREVLSLLENKSTRECEKELVKLSPESVPQKKERTRLLNEELSEVKIVLKNETLEKLERLKNLLSNKNPHISLQELIDFLASEGLKKFDPIMKAAMKREAIQKKQSKAPSAPKVKRSRYIPADLRLKVWSRDEGMCAFTDPLTAKKCGSTFKLHFDHIKPWASGGETTLENLRVLCANHNNLQAMYFYGKEKIERHFHKPH